MLGRGRPWSARLAELVMNFGGNDIEAAAALLFVGVLMNLR